jgi:hypothetical protein
MTIPCELCTNKYPEEMIIDRKYCDFNQCYDCLFSMNFNNKDIITGSMGIKLKDYIELSLKHHAIINEIPCSRLNDNGGCYVCMKMLDIPFDIPFDIPNENAQREEPDKKELQKEIPIKKENIVTKNKDDFKSHNINMNDVNFNMIMRDNLILDI